MFINLGEDTIIRTDEVIAIFDYDLFQNDINNQQFINTTLAEKQFVDIGQQLTKAVVLTNNVIYYSPFSPATLKKRSQSSINSP